MGRPTYLLVPLDHRLAKGILLSRSTPHGLSKEEL